MSAPAQGSITIAESPLLRYVLRRADDALILGHRLSEWCGHAPTMEEDVALANIGLDLLGQARALFAYAAEVESAGHDEDDFAYLRDTGDYGNLLLVEQPNGDFARTMVRLLLYAGCIDPYWRELSRSTDATLAAIAAKAEKESAYHLRHAAEWVIRLGDGTEESHRRAQDALDMLWPFTGEMFATDDAERALAAAGIIPDASTLIANWTCRVSEILHRATLTRPASGWMQQGGRQGRHGEHLGHLLAELQYMQRAFPGARW
jgi:ring-1,2-phenylacetyl-CoA epoxidase subunit PaaC